jgi:DNA-binding transcriptional ArsR family regulator
MKDTNPNTEELEPSVVFATLSNGRRRRILRQLLEHDGAMSVAHLAECVTDGEPGSDQEQVSAELHHVHVPKLADANFVTRDGDAVALADEGEAVKPYLALAARHDSADADGDELQVERA